MLNRMGAYSSSRLRIQRFRHRSSYDQGSKRIEDRDMTRYKPRFVIAIGCLVACLLSGVWWYHFRVVNHPIRFYGRVVDEFGAGIPSVTVRLRLASVKFLSFGAP